MTLLKGIIANSTGVPLTGTLAIALMDIATTDTTDPDTIYTTAPTTLAITNGVLNAELPATEEEGIPYKFVFTKTGELTPEFTVFAIMPALGPVNFASFLPTGITSRNLDVSAYRVGRIIAASSTLSQLIKQPAVFSNVLNSVAVETTLFMPKPFQGAIIARSLTVLGLSGYGDWSYKLGVLNSSGNEEVLGAIATETITQNGRRRIHQTYDISRAASVMGLFMRVTPIVSASPLTATVSISYTEA